jgi:hypothetical protein
MCRCYGPQFNYADSGLWMIPLQNAGLLDIREITACRPGGSATQAARRRQSPSAASPASSSSQSRRLRRDYQLARRVRNGDGCGSISLSACSKVARQLTMRTGDAVMASATRAYGPAFFHGLKDVGTIEDADGTPREAARKATECAFDAAAKDPEHRSPVRF